MVENSKFSCYLCFRSTKIGGIKLQSCAYLGCSGKYSDFAFNEYVIRFRTSSHLQKYSEIKHWDNGYLVVTAHYDTAGEVEEYIDLIPMLKILFIEPDEFLSPIKEVKLKNALSFQLPQE